MAEKKLLVQARDKLRVIYFFYRIEHNCIDWIRLNILFHNKRHPCDISRKDVPASMLHTQVHQTRRALTKYDSHKKWLTFIL